VVALRAPDGSVARQAAWQATDVGPFDPTGSRIVVPTRDPADPAAPPFLVVHDLATGGRRELREAGGAMREPAWSPEGRWIAYVYEPDAAALGHEAGATGTSLLVAVGPDGRGRHVVDADPDAALSHPAWSPDGRWLAYLRRPHVPAGAPPEVWLAGAEGNERSMLATGAADPAWLP
jgi:dipeptidyl aminopeptidase/acylaminoacyl peptidase